MLKSLMLIAATLTFSLSSQAGLTGSEPPKKELDIAVNEMSKMKAHSADEIIKKYDIQWWYDQNYNGEYSPTVFYFQSPDDACTILVSSETLQVVSAKCEDPSIYPLRSLDGKYVGRLPDGTGEFVLKTPTGWLYLADFKNGYYGDYGGSPFYELKLADDGQSAVLRTGETGPCGDELSDTVTEIKLVRSKLH